MLFISKHENNKTVYENYYNHETWSKKYRVINTECMYCGKKGRMTSYSQWDGITNSGHSKTYHEKCEKFYGKKLKELSERYPKISLLSHFDKIVTNMRK